MPSIQTATQPNLNVRVPKKSFSLITTLRRLGLGYFVIPIAFFITNKVATDIVDFFTTPLARDPSYEVVVGWAMNTLGAWVFLIFVAAYVKLMYDYVKKEDPITAVALGISSFTLIPFLSRIF